MRRPKARADVVAAAAAFFSRSKSKREKKESHSIFGSNGSGVLGLSLFSVLKKKKKKKISLGSACEYKTRLNLVDAVHSTLIFSRPNRYFICLIALLPFLGTLSSFKHVRVLCFCHPVSVRQPRQLIGYGQRLVEDKKRNFFSFFSLLSFFLFVKSPGRRKLVSLANNYHVR